MAPAASILASLRLSTAGGQWRLRSAAAKGRQPILEARKMTGRNFLLIKRFPV